MSFFHIQEICWIIFQCMIEGALTWENKAVIANWSGEYGVCVLKHEYGDPHFGEPSADFLQLLLMQGLHPLSFHHKAKQHLSFWVPSRASQRFSRAFFLQLSFSFCSISLPQHCKTHWYRFQGTFSKHLICWTVFQCQLVGEPRCTTVGCIFLNLK